MYISHLLIIISGDTNPNTSTHDATGLIPCIYCIFHLAGDLSEVYSHHREELGLMEENICPTETRIEIKHLGHRLVPSHVDDFRDRPKLDCQTGFRTLADLVEIAQVVVEAVLREELWCEFEVDASIAIGVCLGDDLARDGGQRRDAVEICTRHLY